MKMNREVKQEKRKKECTARKTRTGILVLLMILGMLVGGFYFRGMTASAKNDHTDCYYKSIQLQKGDTLWGIAQQYNTKEGQSTEEYIQKLCKINGIGEEILQENCYLTVLYYEEIK